MPGERAKVTSWFCLKRAALSPPHLDVDILLEGPAVSGPGPQVGGSGQGSQPGLYCSEQPPARAKELRRRWNPCPQVLRGGLTHVVSKY